jgi:hypothetical protein
MKTFKEAFNEIMDAVIVYKQRKSGIVLKTHFGVNECGSEAWYIDVVLGNRHYFASYGDDDIKFTELAESVIEASLEA